MADYIDSFDVNGTEYDLRDKGAVRTTGGTMTGNLTGQHLIGTWLRTTDVTALGSAAARFAVLDGSGWVYYRTKDQLLSDLGLTGVTKITVDSAMSATSTNPVQNKVVKAALDAKQNASNAITTGNIGSQTVNKAVYATDGAAVGTAGLRNQYFASSDTTPTVNGQICWTYG